MIKCSILDEDTNELFSVDYIPEVGHYFFYEFSEHYLTKPWSQDTIEKWREMNGKYFKVVRTINSIRNMGGVESHSISAIVKEDDYNEE